MAQLKRTIGALFCVLCLVVPLTSGESVNFVNKCPTHVANVKGVDVSPFPVHVAQTLAITITASTDTQIAGGLLQIFNTIEGLDVPIENLNLCQTTECPIAVGDFTISFTTSQPQIIPGHNEFHIEARGEDGSTLICISFALEVDII